MKKLGIVITDGVGYRNFILSDFVSQAQLVFDEVVILSYLPKAIYSETNCKVIELPVFEEKFNNWFFRKIKETAHLQLHKKGNFGIQDNIRINKSKAKTVRGYATRLIFKWTHFFNSEKWIQRYNKGQQASFKNDSTTKEYKKILEQEKFDTLFFTHQRPPYIAPLVYQAEKLKVKTCAFIFSWDNLASKGRMAANFNSYLVWSNLMKSELKQFYTNVALEKVKVVGTPQFEPYVLDRYATTKNDFFTKFGLDANKKTICFSCGDISTSKNDELYIETIANAINNNQIANVNFIIRTSPAEDPIRFSKLATAFPTIKWNYPKWVLSRKGHQEEWSQRIPSIEDVKDLRALLEFSDLNINMLSTMSLDFIQFGKPVINTVFGNKENKLYDDQRFLNYAHIDKVVQSNATTIAKTQGELIDAIVAYLNNPSLHKEEREQLLQLQIGVSLQDTSKRIAQFLIELSNE